MNLRATGEDGRIFRYAHLSGTKYTTSVVIVVPVRADGEQVRDHRLKIETTDDRLELEGVNRRCVDQVGSLTGWLLSDSAYRNSGSDHAAQAKRGRGHHPLEEHWMSQNV